MTKKKLLVADDDPSIRTLLCTFLEGEGFHTMEARSGAEVLEVLESERPDLILMDVRMPKMTGIEVLEKLKEDNIEVPVLVMTAHGTATTAITAIQLGAFDYIAKPFELENVLLTINRFFDYQALSKEVESLREQLERDTSERVVGNSPAMREVYKTIGRVATSDATVLITGETGTGKELVARTIHTYSSRKNGPLVTVSCSTLPETLLESELFGHEKGSFTSAIVQRKGRFELAHKGTIFLDEIGEMSLSTQKKLLRVLQEREIERVGGSTPIKVDVRVIAATNKTLQEEVQKKTFREDLFYRVNVITIHLPPLRERREEIPVLVDHFLDKHRFSHSSAPARISEEALSLLQSQDWPGNVRQLENAVQRAVVMARGGTITSQHLYLEEQWSERKFIDLQQKVREKVPMKDVLSEVERQMIVEALHQSHENRSQAAKILGIYRRLLYAKIKEYGISEN